MPSNSSNGNSNSNNNSNGNRIPNAASVVVGGNVNVLSIRILNEIDPFFYYESKISEYEFESIRRQQEFRITFQEFPAHIVELLQLCKSSFSSSSSSSSSSSLPPPPPSLVTAATSAPFNSNQNYFAENNTASSPKTLPTSQQMFSAAVSAAAASDSSSSVPFDLQTKSIRRTSIQIDP